MGGVARRSIVRGGLIGGVGAIYLCLVGIYTKFADLELVGEQITLGRVLIVGAGARRRVRGDAPSGRGRRTAMRCRSREASARGRGPGSSTGVGLRGGGRVRRLVRGRPDPRGLRLGDRSR